MKVMHWLFAVCLFTASFDIVLVFNVGGTLRLCQIILVILAIGGMAKVAQRGTILWPPAGLSLVLWCLGQVAFLPTSLAVVVGLPYYALLFFTIFSVFAVLQLYGDSQYLCSLMKVYLYSYVFVAFFGLFQLVTPSLHLGVFFVNQWILHGKIPRINGFSYEPSYYATYLIMGWIMLMDLRHTKAKITAPRWWRWLTIMVGASLFLSTSRTAWVMMIVEGLARFLPSFLNSMKAQMTKLSKGELRIRIPRLKWIVVTAVAVGMAWIAAWVITSVVDPNIFLSGTGLNNTAAHSVNDRWGRSMQTLQVFWDHPLMGQTLTGVAARIAEFHGASVSSVEDIRLWWGFPVFSEVLAGSGIFGVIPFIWFFAVNTIGNFSEVRRHWPSEEAKWLQALVRGLIFEALVLLGNQNLLRVYLWFHVTVVVIVGFHLRYEKRIVDNAEVVFAV